METLRCIGCGVILADMKSGAYLDDDLNQRRFSAMCHKCRDDENDPVAAAIREQTAMQREATAKKMDIEASMLVLTMLAHGVSKETTTTWQTKAHKDIAAFRDGPQDATETSTEGDEG